MRFLSSLLAACAVCFTLSASAHHSHGQYAETFQDIEGVVKELHLLTPHSWVYIDVKDASGAVQVWALEATTRAYAKIIDDIDTLERAQLLPGGK